MLSYIITFNKHGYEPFFDFVKAYAIICVLVGHTFPYLEETGYALWYGMQVPLFILVQVFHVFKKNTYTLNYKKIIYRILIPYCIVQIIPLCYCIYSYAIDKSLIINYIIGGGYGPGSYFPWVYLQMAFILSIVRTPLNRCSKQINMLISIAICIIFEMLSSIIELPDFIHRLLAIRYFFLIYLGWIWVNEGIVLNVKTLLLSVISMMAVIYLEYFYSPFEPWIYDTAWKTHRWPCYFYVSTLFCSILYYIYDKIKNNSLLMKWIEILAKCSYEIFLLQMLVIPLFPRMDFITNNSIRCGLRICVICIICIIGGYYLNLCYNNFLAKYK